MTLSFSYIAPLINFKISFKDAYKKEPPSYRFASTPLVSGALQSLVGAYLRGGTYSRGLISDFGMSSKVDI